MAKKEEKKAAKVEKNSGQFKPGSTKPINSGRKKGTPNKKTQALAELIEQKYPGFNPVISLIEIALDYNTPLDLKIICLKEVAKYTNAQLKAIEATVKEQNNSMAEFMAGLKEVAK